VRPGLHFSRSYFFIALLIFIVEVLIALYVHDRFIRPYVGDVLVVILIYCFVKAFVRLAVLPAALGVLLFAFAVETLQYFKIVEVLGLERSTIARIIIGTSFAWNDLLAYVAGIAITLAAEYTFRKRGTTFNLN
jgi:hypothetical protein